MKKRVSAEVIVFAIALAARIFTMVYTDAWPDEEQLGYEESVIARHIANGEGFATPFVTDPSRLSPSGHSPPGFPYLLAFLITVFEGLGRYAPYKIAILAGACLGSASIAIIAAAAQKVAGPLAFWIAACVGSIWPPMIANSLVVWDTPYVVLAASVCVYCIACLKDRLSAAPWRAGLIGSVIGLALLFNPNIGPLLLITLAVACFRKQVSYQSALIVCLAAALCIAPWMIRNAVQFHKFVPIRNNFGLELYNGNIPSSDGQTFRTGIVHPHINPEERKKIEMIGEGEYMTSKMNDARRLIDSDPSRFASLSLRRVMLYWLGDVPRQTIIRSLQRILLLLLILLGISCWNSLEGRVGLLLALLIMPAPYYFTHVMISYRSAVEPLMLATSSVAMAFIAKRVALLVKTQMWRNGSIA